MPLLDELLKLAGHVALDFVRRELTSETRWEADPRTKTIQRRKPDRVEVRAEPVRPTDRQRPRPRPEPEVIEMCPRCFVAMAEHKGGRCPRNG